MIQNPILVYIFIINCINTYGLYTGIDNKSTYYLNENKKWKKSKVYVSYYCDLCPCN